MTIQLAINNGDYRSLRNWLRERQYHKCDMCDTYKPDTDTKALYHNEAHVMTACRECLPEEFSEEKSA